ncbi:hypothetical protein H0H87_007637 [Tephrocybe sp. NHM501043]|nr:hypothetical protein H0H87_007637 [Tephrocybe sp. NHM501043]
MRSLRTHIFLTGATALVRDAAKAKEFRTLGVKAVVGSNSDLQLLQQTAADADVAFSCADADNLNAANAILAGLKERFHKTGTPPTFIHTSGTGVLVDDAQGQHSTSDVYSDLDLKKLGSIPDSQPHRNVDLAIVNADNEVKTYIVLPSTIYGLAIGPLVDLGLQNAHSQQIPGLVRIALERGEAGYVGSGKNVWPHVHIKEVTDLFILIFDQALTRKDLGHGRQGFYFGENGEYVMWNIAKAVAQTLHDAGKIKSSMPSSFTEEEMQQRFPNESVDPISIAGFCVAGAIVLGLGLWVSVALSRKRANAKRQSIRNDAFLSVRGLIKEGRPAPSSSPSEKTPVNPLLFSRQDIVLPGGVLQPPPRAHASEDVIDYHRQSGTFPKPFSLALSAASFSAHTHSSDRNRFSVYSTTSSIDTNPTVGTVRRVRQAFDPVLPDELVIRDGESLTLVQSFDDGWCIVGRDNASVVMDAKSLFRPNTVAGQAIELGVIPAWCFIRPAPGLRAERPIRSTSLGITVKLNAPESSCRDNVISWSNF